MLVGIKVFTVTLVSVGALSVAPSHVQPVLSVKPVEVQHFSQLTEPSDIQPAMGVKVLQNTTSPEPNVGLAVRLQPATYVGAYQRTFSPQQQ